MDVSPWAFRILSAGVGPGVDILFFEGARPHAFSIGLGHGQQLSNTIFFISTIPHHRPLENMMQRTIFIGTHISFLSHSLSFRLVFDNISSQCCAPHCTSRRLPGLLGRRIESTTPSELTFLQQSTTRTSHRPQHTLRTPHHHSQTPHQFPVTHTVYLY